MTPKTPEQLQKIFEAETGEKAIVTGTDGVHCVLISAPSPRYMEWLEARVIAAEGKASRAWSCETLDCQCNVDGKCDNCPNYTIP